MRWYSKTMHFVSWAYLLSCISAGSYQSSPADRKAGSKPSSGSRPSSAAAAVAFPAAAARPDKKLRRPSSRLKTNTVSAATTAPNAQTAKNTVAAVPSGTQIFVGAQEPTGFFRSAATVPTASRNASGQNSRAQSGSKDKRSLLARLCGDLTFEQLRSPFFTDSKRNRETSSDDSTTVTPRRRQMNTVSSATVVETPAKVTRAIMSSGPRQPSSGPTVATVIRDSPNNNNIVMTTVGGRPPALSRKMSDRTGNTVSQLPAPKPTVDRRPSQMSRKSSNSPAATTTIVRKPSAAGALKPPSLPARPSPSKEFVDFHERQVAVIEQLAEHVRRQLIKSPLNKKLLQVLEYGNVRVDFSAAIFEEFEVEIAHSILDNYGYGNRDIVSPARVDLSRRIRDSVAAEFAPARLVVVLRAWAAFNRRTLAYCIAGDCAGREFDAGDISRLSTAAGLLAIIEARLTRALKRVEPVEEELESLYKMVIESLEDEFIPGISNGDTVMSRQLRFEVPRAIRFDADGQPKYVVTVTLAAAVDADFTNFYTVYEAFADRMETALAATGPANISQAGRYSIILGERYTDLLDGALADAYDKFIAESERKDPAGTVALAKELDSTPSVPMDVLIFTASIIEPIARRKGRALGAKAPAALRRRADALTRRLAAVRESAVAQFVAEQTPNNLRLQYIQTISAAASRFATENPMTLRVPPNFGAPGDDPQPFECRPLKS